MDTKEGQKHTNNNKNGNNTTTNPTSVSEELLTANAYFSLHSVMSQGVLHRVGSEVHTCTSIRNHGGLGITDISTFFE